MPKFKTALVTGGAGFIGSHIVDALIRRRIKVYVIDDLSTGKRSNVNPNAHFTKLSIVSPQMIDYLKRVKPEVIFHCAAHLDLRKSLTDPIHDAEINITGSLHVIHGAVQAGVKKIIFSSTGGPMYDERESVPLSDALPVYPIAPYAIAKHSVELYLRYAFQVHGLPSVALRYANVYGPRQNAKGEAGVISIFSTQMIAGKPVTIFGTGKATRDYVYVEDVVRANMLAMDRAVVGTFNIGTGRETSVNAIFKKLKTATGYQLPARYTAAIPGELMRSALDAKKARKELGWEPKTRLDDGLKKTIKSFMKTA